MASCVWKGERDAIHPCGFYFYEINKPIHKLALPVLLCVSHWNNSIPLGASWIFITVYNWCGFCCKLVECAVFRIRTRFTLRYLLYIFDIAWLFRIAHFLYSLSNPLCVNRFVWCWVFAVFSCLRCVLELWGRLKVIVHSLYIIHIWKHFKIMKISLE